MKSSHVNLSVKPKKYIENALNKKFKTQWTKREGVLLNHLKLGDNLKMFGRVANLKRNHLGKFTSLSVRAQEKARSHMTGPIYKIRVRTFAQSERFDRLIRQNKRNINVTKL
jgi:hypothetical protein